MQNRTMSPAIQIVTTTEKREDAEKIAGMLIDRRLAACVQVVGPVFSTYRWEANVESSQEWQCQIKTSAERYHDVEAVIRDHHPYKVPEIIAMPIVQGSQDYLAWLYRAVSDES